MDSRWIKHIKDAEERAQLKARLEGMQEGWDILIDLISRMEADATKTKWSQRLFNYAGASWPYQQADLNATLRTLQEVKALIPKGD